MGHHIVKTPLSLPVTFVWLRGHIDSLDRNLVHQMARHATSFSKIKDSSLLTLDLKITHTYSSHLVAKSDKKRITSRKSQGVQRSSSLLSDWDISTSSIPISSRVVLFSGLLTALREREDLYNTFFPAYNSHSVSPPMQKQLDSPSKNWIPLNFIPRYSLSFSTHFW